MSTQSPPLRLFGRIPVNRAFARRVELFGFRLPLAAIVVALALTLMGLALAAIILSRAPAHITQTIHHDYAVSDDAFVRSMGVLLGPPLLPGNRVETLVNGDRIFPSMLQAIR